MAIKFLHDLDLTGQEIQNLKLHVTSSAPTAAIGAIYFDSGANALKVGHDNGSGGVVFKTLSTDTSDDNTEYNISAVDASGAKLRLNGTDSTNDDVEFAGAGTVSVAVTNANKITITGASASAASATATGVLKLFSDTTQSVEANEVTTTNGRTYGLQVDSNGRGVVNVPWTDSAQLTTEEVQDIVGAMFSGNTETRISATYQDSDGTIDLAVDNMNYTHPTHDGDDISIDTGALTGATVISDLDFNITTNTLGHVTDANAAVSTRDLTLGDLGYTGATDANNYSLDLSKLNTVTSAMTGSQTLTFGDSGDDTTVVIKGNLTVIGTTTTNNVETVSTSNGVQFEGSAANDNEILLKAGTVSTDRTITLPDASGTVALTSDITGTNSGTNTGDEVAATTSVAGIVELATDTEANAGSDTDRAVTPANLGAFTGTSNITTVGTIATGTWQGSAISTDYISNLSGTNTGDESDATTSAKGIVELATATEAKNGSGSQKVVDASQIGARSVHATIDVSNSTFASGNQVCAIQHDLGTEDVIVQLFDSSTKETVYAVVERKTFAGSASTSTIRITFSEAPANDIEVVITSTKGGTVKTPSYS
tara:strand:+ start:133 stop:1923 length:1791 start_codon:yes stop_codon:yes gene_type:complete